MVTLHSTVKGQECYPPDHILRRGADVGIERRLRQKREGWKPYNAPPDFFQDWRNWIMGSMAESVACWAFGLPWEPSLSPDKDLGDIGPGWPHVKATGWATGRLLVQENDAPCPDHPFDPLYLLIVGGWPAWRIVGTMRGSIAKDRPLDYSMDRRRPCYAVEQWELDEWTVPLVNVR